MSSPRLLAEILFTRPWYRVLLISLSAGSAVAGLVAAFAQKEFVDTMLGKALVIDGLTLHPIIWLLGSFIGLLLSLVMSQAVNYVGSKESLWMQGRLAERLYDRILKLQSSDLRGRSVGEIVAIYTTDIPGATILVEQSMPQCFNILFPLILAPVALIMMFQLPPTFVFAVLAGVIAINLVLALRQSRFFSNFKRLAADRVGLVNEWVQNIRTLRVLGLIEAFENKLIAVREVETTNRIKMVTNGQTMNAVSSSMTFVINMLFILVLTKYHPAEITPGSLLALLWIVGIFMTRPFRQIPWFFTFVFDGWTSLKRLAGALAIQSVEPVIETSKAGPNEPALVVRDLNLKIHGQSLLTGINIELQEGEFSAVVGEVGSGKSLLFQSLLAEAPAHFKSYRLLGEDMSTRTKPEIRRHFAFVPQEGFTMSATLLENVSFDYHLSGTSEDLRQEIENALRLSEFRSAQERLASGLTTEIGERGVNLSGGQKQRISLARAVYSKAPILLLDDTFSALDTDTENKLIEGLFATRWKNRTCLLATHRLSVLSKVNRIYFMGDGRIIDVGTWNELRGRSKAFNDFVHTVEAREAAQTPAAAKSTARPEPIPESVVPPENPSEVISED